MNTSQLKHLFVFAFGWDYIPANPFFFLFFFYNMELYKLQILTDDNTAFY